MNPLLKDIFVQAATLVKSASASGKTLASAESCTGGLIGAAITTISGSSAAYHGGIIAYDNAVKIGQLGVDEAVIDEHGAVSEQTAIAMAKGAVKAIGVDIGLSVTGVAGPSGGSTEKPVGTVWFGVAKRGVSGEITAEATLITYGDIGRNLVRDKAVLDALKLLIAAV